MKNNYTPRSLTTIIASTLFLIASFTPWICNLRLLLHTKTINFWQGIIGLCQSLIDEDFTARDEKILLIILLLIIMSPIILFITNFVLAFTKWNKVLNIITGCILSLLLTIILMGFRVQFLGFGAFLAFFSSLAILIASFLPVKK